MINNTPNQRLSKRTFMRLVAGRAGIPEADVTVIVESILAEIVRQARLGVQVNLTGFGHFRGRMRKGAPAQFGMKGRRLPDYPTLTFSAARNVNRFLALGDQEIVDQAVPGTRQHL